MEKNENLKKAATLKGQVTIPDIGKYNDLLYSFVQRSREILGDNLTGIYLHGSSVMGCFNKSSDIDSVTYKHLKLQKTT